MPATETYANGGLGTSIEIDGKYYWANIQWEAKKAGTIELNLVDNLLNVTEGTVTVEDEAIIEKVKEILPTVKSFTGQVWYADKSATSEIQITDAYIKVSGTEDPTEGDTEETSESGEVTVTKYGDADNSGEVDILDVITVNRAILGKEELSEQGLVNVDFNKDGKPDSTEALAIMKRIVSLLTDDDLANF